MPDDRMKVQEHVAAMRTALGADLEANSVEAMNVMAEATKMAAADGGENEAGMNKLKTDLVMMAALATRAMAEREGGAALPAPPIGPAAGPSAGTRSARRRREAEAVTGDEVPEADPVLGGADLTVPSNPAVRDAVRLAVPMINNFVRDIGRARIVLEMAFLERPESADAALNFIVLKVEVTNLLSRLEHQALERLNEWTLYFQQRPDRVLKAAALSHFQDLADSMTTMDAQAAMSVQTAASEVVAGYAAVKGKMAEVWNAIDTTQKQKDNVRQLYG